MLPSDIQTMSVTSIKQGIVDKIFQAQLNAAIKALNILWQRLIFRKQNTEPVWAMLVVL